VSLGSASHVVIGATDPAATRAFFAAFGFVDDTQHPGSMVRGLGHRTELAITEAESGRQLSDYDLGPRGLDLYTTDIDRSLVIAGDAGADVGSIGVVEIGPMVMRQATVWGPDGIPLVFIENSSRRASLLDDAPEELHSEVHSLVWAVADRDAESQWWEERGMTKGMDLSFDHPAVAEFMRLPDPIVELQMVMLANEANDPIRFEVLEFAGHEGGTFEPGMAGIQAVGFTVPGESAHRLVTPGGVHVDIRG
jgi:catechol 2,3-dioxygenase-like lactoylglutathione lyase family enzyme